MISSHRMRRTVIIITSAFHRFNHSVTTVTGTPHWMESTQTHDGELIMKKFILAAAAFASLMAMGSAPASAFGCTTQWVNGRITQVCDSAVAGSMLNVGRPRILPPVRCRQGLGFNQPYICN